MSELLSRRPWARWVTLGATIALPPSLTLVGIAALFAVTVERGYRRARSVAIATGMALVAVVGTVVLYAGL